MELLCRCDDIPDDGVELRVLKGLLTAVTSSTINVHGQARRITPSQLSILLTFTTIQSFSITAHGQGHEARLEMGHCCYLAPMPVRDEQNLGLRPTCSIEMLGEAPSNPSCGTQDQ